MNERQTIDDMYREIEEYNMEDIPLEAELHFALAINKIVQLDERVIDMSKANTALLVKQAIGHYKQALLAIEYRDEG